MSEDRTRMMRDAGPPWNQNLLMVGPRGPVVFEDMLLFEKMAHSTVSASPSASCTPRGRAPTATSSAPMPTCRLVRPRSCSARSESGRRRSCFDRGYEAFRADLRTVFAVTRCLEVISEASRRLPTR
jgi:hypothetical protein